MKVQKEKDICVATTNFMFQFKDIEIMVVKGATRNIVVPVPKENECRIQK